MIDLFFSKNNNKWVSRAITGYYFLHFGVMKNDM